MKSLTPLLAVSNLSTTCQGQSNRRAKREWWASSEKPPGSLTQTAQQDGYAGRLLFTIAGEAKWMSAGFHLTGNLRNVREVTVNELFWICLVISFFPFQTKYVFSCWSNAVEWLKWVFTWLKLILALSALVSSFSGIERTGWTFSCSSLKVVYFSAVAGTRYIKTHMQLLTVLELTRMKTINMYRKAGHHPRVSSLASPKMWHLPLFIVHMLHPQFRLWSLIPTQRLPSLSSLPPTNPSSHINQ